MSGLNFPIIDLHCHLEGSIDPEKSYKILHDIGYPPALQREEFFKLVNGFESGREAFFNAVSLLNMCLIDQTSVTKVVSDIITRAAEQNVKILELSFAPREFKLQKNQTGDLRPYIKSVIAGIEAGSHNRDISVGLNMLFLPRHLTDEFYKIYGDVRDIISEYRQYISGIDICTLDPLDEVDKERHNPTRLREICEFARESGLHLSAHAGEFFGPEPVEKAIDIGVDRIGHGICIAGNENLIEKIKARNITLEVCPISNYRTEAVASNLEHPLLQLFRAGVRVTINSDDQSVQKSSFRDDYNFSEKKIGLTRNEIMKCLRYSFEASFLNSKEKSKYSELFTENKYELNSY